MLTRLSGAADAASRMSGRDGRPGAGSEGAHAAVLPAQTISVPARYANPDANPRPKAANRSLHCAPVLRLAGGRRNAAPAAGVQVLIARRLLIVILSQDRSAKALKR